MKCDSKDKIIKHIIEMSGRYSSSQIFSDWVECTALAIQNNCQAIRDDTWNKREELFRQIIRKYDMRERKRFTEMMALLIDAFEDELSDILGGIYMESGCGSKMAGQFFTPFHLSKLTAAVGVPEDISEDNPLKLNEPSTGGGGMIIAVASVLKDRGINYQKCMKVIARDLDWRAVYMTYVQLSIIGVKAAVIQGSALDGTVPDNSIKERILRTPAEMGMII